MWVGDCVVSCPVCSFPPRHDLVGGEKSNTRREKRKENERTAGHGTSDRAECEIKPENEQARVSLARALLGCIRSALRPAPSQERRVKQGRRAAKPAIYGELVKRLPRLIDDCATIVSQGVVAYGQRSLVLPYGQSLFAIR